MMPTLVKQSLFPELETIERRFHRLFGEMPFMPAFVAPMVPAADVYETPMEYVVELEVPGFEEKELSLEISDHRLAIKGAREETKEEKEQTYQLHERLERAFERTFTLPPEVDGANASATFEKSVLKVHVPKLVTSEPHAITISKL
jgi:HSP20 family protein